MISVWRCVYCGTAIAERGLLESRSQDGRGNWNGVLLQDGDRTIHACGDYAPRALTILDDPVVPPGDFPVGLSKDAAVLEWWRNFRNRFGIDGEFPAEGSVLASFELVLRVKKADGALVRWEDRNR